MNDNNINSDHDIAATLASNKERLNAFLKEINRLEAQLARGTRDLVTKELTPPLTERAREVLKLTPQSPIALAKALNESSDAVNAVLKTLRPHLYNAGSDRLPMWFWVCGDACSVPEVNVAVAALIRFRPMTFLELLEATKARAGRVSGAITELKKTCKDGQLINLGSGRRARWFVVPDPVKPLTVA